jgi:hypothetical protein
MNANALAKHYDRLTPEERFRLILAASGRGDAAERQRLANAAPRVGFSMPDHSPYGHAFYDLAVFTFIELVEEAACYLDALTLLRGARNLPADEGAEGEDAGGEGDGAEAEEAGAGDAKTPARWRHLDMIMVFGFALRTKAEGWKLFCERMSVPPFLLWEDYPGFDRLQRALALAQTAAFTPEGMLRWLNEVRPVGAPERTAVPLSVEGVADATAKMFREQAGRWGV